MTAMGWGDPCPECGAPADYRSYEDELREAKSRLIAAEQRITELEDARAAEVEQADQRAERLREMYDSASQERSEARRDATTHAQRAEKAEANRDRLQRECERLREALRTLTEGAVQNIIRGFYEPGHPGRPCIRSGWVRVDRHKRAVADITAARSALDALEKP